ncbi:MAG: FAD/NAD(P)-binding protein, partial [Deltaproteobacteria bacterium]
MYFEFAIIGGGLTSTSMLSQLVTKVRDRAANGHLNPSKIAVLIFEKQNVFGPGFPHNERFALPFHVTNMCAFDMGVLDGKPDDFQNWVTCHSKQLRSRFPWFPGPSSQSRSAPDGCNHYPRATMGEYLKATFEESVRTARNLGLRVSLYPAAEVVNLLPAEKRVHLTVRDLASK